MILTNLTAEQSANLQVFIDEHRTFLSLEEGYNDFAVFALQDFYDPQFKKTDKKANQLKAVKHRQLWTDLKMLLLDPSSYSEPDALNGKGKKTIGHLLSFIELSTWTDHLRIAYLYAIVVGDYEAHTITGEVIPFRYLEPDAFNLIAAYACLSDKYFHRYVC